jgi:hypothetical protein
MTFGIIYGTTRLQNASIHCSMVYDQNTEYTVFVRMESVQSDTHAGALNQAKRREGESVLNVMELSKS